MKAKITISLENPEIAKAVANSLVPDNQQAQGMRVITRARGRKVETEISFKGRIQTMIATIDDLLKCTQAAEKTLRTADKKRQPKASSC